MDSGDHLVGDAAKNQATVNPENTVFDVKRLIGRNYSDKSVQADTKLVPYGIVSDNNKPVVQVTVGGKTSNFAPEEVSAMILGKIKVTAETFLGKDINNAVVTVPAYFNDAQRQQGCRNHCWYEGSTYYQRAYCCCHCLPYGQDWM